MTSVISAAEQRREYSMVEIWEIEYLTLVERVFTELSENGGIRNVFVSEEGEKPELVLIPDLPVEDVEIRISIEHILEGSEQLHIMVAMFGGVPAERLADAERVVARINEFLILGNAAIFYEGGLIFYNHAFAFDREMNAAVVTGLIGKSLQIILHTVPQIMEILEPVLDGSITADALLAEGIGLIQ